ncbi:MAG: response regulator transcription factor, partial [Acidobacteriota bacterium]
MSRKILIVEDEPSLALTLEDRLRSEGYAVAVEEDGELGFERAQAETFDLVILDVNLPSKNGLDICRDLRRRGLSAPILMLTARADLLDKVLGLKLGADDYLTKPFEHMELIARVEALLRRAPALAAAGARRIHFGDVAVDFEAAEVEKDGHPVDLSALELRLLEYFLEHRGKVLSRDTLLDDVWGYDATPVTRTVDVHVASLRQKIEDVPSKPRFLLTVHGRGYK